MNKKDRVQQKIMFWFDDKTLGIFDWFHTKIQRAICHFYGHTPTRDQCGKPEHDFCLWCMKLTPGQWRCDD